MSSNKNSIRWDIFARGAAFVVLAGFLGSLVQSGRITLLLKPGLVWMVGVSALVLIFLGITQMRSSLAIPQNEHGGETGGEACECGHHHRHEAPVHHYHECGDSGCDHSHTPHHPPRTAPSTAGGHSQGRRPLSWLLPLCLFMLPVIFGLSTRLVVLDANAAAQRGLELDLSGTVSGSDPSSFESLVSQLNKGDRTMEGREVEFIGFVSRWGDMKPNEMMVVRFSVTCCVADAVPLGFTVEWPQASTLSNDHWVQVTGNVRYEQRGTRAVPIISAREVESVSAPEMPYIYPGK